MAITKEPIIIHGYEAPKLLGIGAVIMIFFGAYLLGKFHSKP